MGDTGNIDDYTNADSVNLKTVDGQNFTIVAWERSDYEDTVKNKTSKGIKFTVKEDFDGISKLHTTRQVIVQKFYKTDDKGLTIPTQLGQDVSAGKEFFVRCKEVEAKKGGNNYFDLVAGVEK